MGFQIDRVTLRQITLPLVLGCYWSHQVAVTTVFDLKMLRQHKVFWSEVQVVFRRLRT